jgi:MFS transporter, DHA2 family, multidrug resistance protein
MCGQSGNIWELVVWRFVQGVGGGALLATSQSILVEIYPREKMGMASAMFGMGVILGPTIGPVLGGYLIDHFDWPVIFYVNIPIGVAACLLTLEFIRNNPYHVKSKARVDWLGMFLLIAGIGSLQLVLEQGERADWFESMYIVGFFGIALVGVAWFIWRELTIEHPIVDLHVLRRGNVGIGVTLSFILGFALFGTVFVYPMFVQRFLGFTATQSGAMFVPGALLTGFCMPFIGRMLQKGIPPKLLITLGFTITAGFVWWSSFLLSPVTGAGDFFLPLLLRGLGMGLLFVPLNNLTLGGLHGRDIPQAAGLSSMIRQIGGSISVALVGVFTERRTAQHRTDLLNNLDVYNPNLTERLNMYIGNFSRFGTDVSHATQQAYYVLDNAVTKQAMIITYIDVFRYMAIFVMMCVPLIVFARAYKSKVEAGAAH